MTADAATYARARAAGIPAKYALALARPRTLALDWTTDRKGRQTARLNRDGYDLHVVCEPDYDTDPADGLGSIEWPERYSDHPDRVPAGTVRITTRQGYAFWRSETPLADRVKYHRDHGASRSVALDMARADVRAEAAPWNGSDGPSSYGVVVTASRAGVELGSASVWGCTVDWDPITRSDGTEYLDETACDLIPEAIADAAESLARLQTGDTE